MSFTDKLVLKVLVRCALGMCLLFGLQYMKDTQPHNGLDSTLHVCTYNGKVIDQKFCDPAWIASHQKFIKGIQALNTTGAHHD